MSNKPRFDYFKSLDLAVTVCDTECVVLYMNEKAVATFGRDLTGESMLGCHSEQSRKKIEELILTESSNKYTIEKRGIKKLIYQTPWYDNDGSVGGLVELSMEIPMEMTHYLRG